jgi:hypothetical protein
MYDLLDRPVMNLSPGGRFILWAMRGWTRAVSTGYCPPGALAPAFARHGVLPALPHLHILLASLNRSATRKLAFAPLQHRRIGDDEAVLLQMCRDARNQPTRARATLELLMDEEAVSDAFTSLLAFLMQLQDSRLDQVSLQRVDATGSF